MLVELINLEKKLKASQGDHKSELDKTILSKDWRTREEALAEIEWKINKENKMLLKSVSFKDYCLYAGEHTFDLAPVVKFRKNSN